jgi:probable O-glycosylation ligase (exosortase A-associated)
MDNPLLGGGFQVFPHAEVWLRYMPEWNSRTTAFNAHSIYFQVLGEHGFLGLGLFIALLACTLLSLRTIRRRARRIADGAWLEDYAYMVQIGIVAFMVAGAFYNLAYFDLLYFLVGVAIVLKQLLAEQLAVRPSEVAEPVEVGPPAARSPWDPHSSGPATPRPTRAPVTE